MWTLEKEQFTKKMIKELISLYNNNFSYISIRYEKASYTTIQGYDLEEHELITSSENGFTVTITKENSTLFNYFCTNIFSEVEQYLKENMGSEVKKKLEHENKETFVANRELFRQYKEINNKERISLLSQVHSLSLDKELTLLNFSLTDCFKKIFFYDSLGMNTELNQCHSTFYADIFLLEDTNNLYSLPISVASYEKYLFSSIIESELEDIKRILSKLLSEPTIPTPNGIFNVVLCPELAGAVLHETIGHSSEADTFSNNILPLNTKITNENINIYDVPLESSGFDYDDEGQKCKPVNLVKNGVFINLLHSKKTTSKELSGNGRSINYRFAPICRMRQTVLSPGKLTLSQLLTKLDTGLYLIGYRSGSTYEGNYTIESSYGFYIKKGQIVSMFPSVNINGNIQETLINIKEIGNDSVLTRDAGGCNKNGQNGLPNEMKSPPLLINHMRIGDNLEYE